MYAVYSIIYMNFSYNYFINIIIIVIITIMIIKIFFQINNIRMCQL